MGSIGGSELIVVGVIFFLLFGANRLPEAGRAVGRGLREFRRALNEARDAVQESPSPPPTTPRRRLSD